MPDPVDPTPAPTPTPAPAPEPKADEPLGEGGMKALQAEREARAAAEAESKRLKAIVDASEASKLSDIEKAQKERDEASTRASTLERENWRLAALAEHPVSKDNRDIVVGNDAESFLASAKRISELEAAAKGTAKSGVVQKSGTSGGDPAPTGGSIDTGRDLYTSKHKPTS